MTGFSQSLEQLADRIDENTDPRRKKTTVRRLYDITNVLKALGLVKKSVNSEKNVMIEWQGKNLINEGLEGLIEAETKHARLREFETPFIFSTPKHAIFDTPGPKVPNMQSAFRVSKSAIFEQTSPASLGKRAFDHIPQAVMQSIEGLVDPGKVIIVEARRPVKNQYNFGLSREEFIENIENIHPNLTDSIKQSTRTFINDTMKARIPLGLLSLKDEAQI